jgi:hypothetical protein
MYGALYLQLHFESSTLHDGEPITAGQAYDLFDQREIEEQLQQEVSGSGGTRLRATATERR